MNKLPKNRFHLVFSLLIGLMMVTVVTFVITLVNLGWTPDFFSKWGKVFIIAYAIATPIIYFFAPKIRMLTAKFVEMP